MSVEVKSVSCHALAERCRSGEPVDIIDVRTPIEFREVHAENSRNVPLDALDPHAVLSERRGKDSDPVYLICRSGNRASRACEAFAAVGFPNVVNIDGGIQAWEAEGLPVKRGKKAVSLERQVRIAAGFLVFLGATLGFFVHPYWIGLSAFVGAGLMFAGITDTCAMGLLIARMPWNQIRTSSQPNSAATEDSSNEPCCTTSEGVTS